jgi:hypothetical protein
MAVVNVQAVPANPPLAAVRGGDGRLSFFASVDEKVYWGPQRNPNGRFADISTPGGGLGMPMRGLAAETNADGRAVLFGVNGAGQIFQTTQLTAGGPNIGPGTGYGWSS